MTYKENLQKEYEAIRAMYFSGKDKTIDDFHRAIAAHVLAGKAQVYREGRAKSGFNLHHVDAELASEGYLPTEKEGNTPNYGQNHNPDNFLNPEQPFFKPK